MIEKGQKINDRYEIIKSIGEGGMANVYLAYDTILDRRVAIKVLRGDLSNDEKFVRRFQREALSASSLSHPNIVEMYDVGEDNGIYYIVMEYIEGKTLKQLIKKRGSLTLSEAIDIMLQLTDGISQAHDSYIIHRDLKPQNILIKEDGLIKITDFGIAMALNSTQLTQTNSVMGSVHYLPPEQASGKGSTIRSDIYSMGILFYELLTGNLPFKGDNAVEIALKQMRDDIPRIRKKNPAIPQSVENVVLKATAKNPKNRYADVKEMHADLLTVLNDERMDEKRIEFKYPEHDFDDNTKTISAIKKKTDDKIKEVEKEEEEEKEKEDVVPKIEEKEEKDEKISEEQETDKKEELQEKEEEKKEIEEGEEEDYEEDKLVKRTNKIIWVLTAIFTVAVIAVISIFLIVPYFTKTPDVEIPKVAEKSVAEAEKVLKKAGFEVALETVKEESSTIPEGMVIKTSPSAGRTVKKGTTITIYESTGEKVYEVEDYTGKNYIEVQTELEKVYGLKVEIEERDNDSDEFTSQQVIGQSVEPGTTLTKGDEIKLYIPKGDDGIPDIVGEEWTVDDAQAFCDKYGLILKVEEVETTEYPEGKIIKQYRSPKTPIIKGSTLKIEVAKAPAPTPTPTPIPTPSTTPTPSATPTTSNSDNEPSE